MKRVIACIILSVLYYQYAQGGTIADLAKIEREHAKACYENGYWHGVLDERLHRVNKPTTPKECNI
jgi:hypothetical protein